MDSGGGGRGGAWGGVGGVGCWGDDAEAVGLLDGSGVSRARLDGDEVGGNVVGVMS